MESPQDENPGLTPHQYQQLIQFLVTWSALTPQEAEEHLAGRSHPGQVTRSIKPPVCRPIYPPGARSSKPSASQ